MIRKKKPAKLLQICTGLCLNGRYFENSVISKATETSKLKCGLAANRYACSWHQNWGRQLKLTKDLFWFMQCHNNKKQINFEKWNSCLVLTGICFHFVPKANLRNRLEIIFGVFVTSFLDTWKNILCLPTVNNFFHKNCQHYSIFVFHLSSLTSGCVWNVCLLHIFSFHETIHSLHIIYKFGWQLGTETCEMYVDV